MASDAETRRLYDKIDALTGLVSEIHGDVKAIKAEHGPCQKQVSALRAAVFDPNGLVARVARNEEAVKSTVSMPWLANALTGLVSAVTVVIVAAVVAYMAKG